MTFREAVQRAFREPGEPEEVILRMTHASLHVSTEQVHRELTTEQADQVTRETREKYLRFKAMTWEQKWDFVRQTMEKTRELRGARN
jgi:hypothetical protein